MFTSGASPFDGGRRDAWLNSTCRYCGDKIDACICVCTGCSKIMRDCLCPELDMPDVNMFFVKLNPVRDTSGENPMSDGMDAVEFIADLDRSVAMDGSKQFESFSLWVAGLVLENDGGDITIPEILRHSDSWAFGMVSWSCQDGSVKTVARRTAYRYVQKLVDLGLLTRLTGRRGCYGPWTYTDSGLIDYFEEELS